MRKTILISFALVTACGGPKECKLDDVSSCPSSLACETVQGRQAPLCLAPVTLEGRVFDITATTGIVDAEVIATDENGAPAGNAVKTTTGGAYTLRIPTARTDDKGTFVGRKVMLRSQAKNDR